MFTRIVVPLDGSKLSEQVLPYAAILARGFGGGLHLVHAVEAGAAGMEERYRTFAEQVVQQERKEAAGYLQRVQDQVSQRHIPVTTRAVLGWAADAIVAEAQQESADAIAMATHGRAGMQRLFLGSVADKVLHSTTLPLLLLRPREDGAQGREPVLRLLLVPLDGSALAEQVIPTAESFARALGLRLRLLRVVSMPVLAFADAYGAASAEAYVQVLEGLEEEADRYLADQAAAFAARGIEADVIRGRVDAAAEIVRTAEQEEGTLVMMSTHGRSGLGRAVLGSVADRVVREHRGPVVLLRGRA